VHAAVQRGHVGCLKLLLPDRQATQALFDEHKETPLHLIDHSSAAVCHELTATLLTAPNVQSQAVLNAQDRHGSTALHHTAPTHSSDESAVAAAAVCYTCMNALLAAGADPTLTDQHDRSLLSRLMEAVELHDDADVAQCIRTVKALQRAGVDVDQSCCLHEVVAQNDSAGKVQVLLACGAKPDTRNEQGWTAMHAAAAWSEACSTSLAASNAAVIQLLFGVNNAELLNAVTCDSKRQTALHLAVAWPNNVERLLQLGAAVNAVDSSGCIALHAACAAPASVSAPESVRLLLAAGATAGMHCSQYPDCTEGGRWQAVHWAVMQFDTDDASTETAQDVLLESGVSVDATTTEGCTAAWLVARYSTETEEACDLLDVLLQRGADLYHYTPQHGSLLHAAALSGSVDIMKWLLKKGLAANSDNVPRVKAEGYDLILRNGAGETPLHCAARAGYVQLVELLIREECDFTATDLKGNSALRACLLGGKLCDSICKLLIAAGDDVFVDVLPDTG
jgi:ankyrin repeat protein